MKTCACVTYNEGHETSSVERTVLTILLADFLQVPPEVSSSKPHFRARCKKARHRKVRQLCAQGLRASLSAHRKRTRCAANEQ